MDRSMTGRGAGSSRLQLQSVPIHDDMGMGQRRRESLISDPGKRKGWATSSAPIAAAAPKRLSLLR